MKIYIQIHKEIVEASSSSHSQMLIKVHKITVKEHQELIIIEKEICQGPINKNKIISIHLIIIRINHQDIMK